VGYRRRHSAQWFACVVAASIGGVARAEVERVGTDPASGITIEIEGWAGIRTPATGREAGLVPLDVTITNLSPADHAWTIGPDERFGSPRGPLPAATIAVPAGGTGRATFYVDVDRGGDTYLAVKGHAVSGGMSLVSVASRPSPPNPSSEADWRRTYVGQSKRVLAARAGTTADRDAVPLDMSRAPRDWRGWAAFQTILVTDAEWRALPADARKAALEWITLGGRLVVFATPGGEPLAGLPTGGLGDGGPFRVGEATIVWHDGAPITEQEIARHNVGRPRIDAYASEVSGLDDDGLPGGGPAQIGGYGFANLIALFGPRTLPVAAILAFLAVFGLVAGPLNVMVIAGPGRRSRMFWTTPAISLVATAFLLGLMFLRDGVGGAGARRVLTILDPAASTTAVIQEQFSRTGVLLGSTFPVREPSWMHPLADTADGEPLVEVDGAARSGGWFRSRSDQAYLLEAVRPSRARIEFVARDGAAGLPAVVSSVDVPLRRVFVIDDEGLYWQTIDVGTGERKALQPTDRANFDQWLKDHTDDAGPVRQHAIDRARNRRGCAFAETDRPGRLAIDTLGSIRWIDDLGLIVCPVTKGAAP